MIGKVRFSPGRGMIFWLGSGAPAHGRHWTNRGSGALMLCAENERLATVAADARSGRHASS